MTDEIREGRENSLLLNPRYKFIPSRGIWFSRVSLLVLFSFLLLLIIYLKISETLNCTLTTLCHIAARLLPRLSPFNLPNSPILTF